MHLPKHSIKKTSLGTGSSKCSNVQILPQNTYKWARQTNNTKVIVYMFVLYCLSGMVSALDDAVGNVTSALREKGILDNTIIIFSTDNGGPANGFDMNHACHWPLR